MSPSAQLQVLCMGKGNSPIEGISGLRPELSLILAHFSLDGNDPSEKYDQLTMVFFFAGTTGTLVYSNNK